MRRTPPILVSDAWESTLSSLEAKPHAVVSIVGPKGSGKSTFAKELFRRLITRHEGKPSKNQIAFVDTDLGRPEFTLPGVVSVHIPGASTEEPLLKGAFFLGEQDPSQAPDEYLDAIQKLGSLVREKEFKFVVVNTHGWVSGLGQDLLEALLVHVGATDIVQIVPENKMTSLGSLLRPTETMTIWTLTPAKEGRQRESKLSIERRLVDHFFQESSMFAVGMRKVKIKYPPSVDRMDPPSYLPLVLNASIVGLARGEGKHPEDWLGLGIVCAVDVDKQCLFVQTRVAPDVITQCGTLVVGSSCRVPLHHLPSVFPSGNSEARVELEMAEEEEEVFLPYLTACRLIGFGTVQANKGVLKRRRLEGGSQES